MRSCVVKLGGGLTYR